MSAPLTAAIPSFAQLGYNTTVVVEALDPTTGAPVTGVVVSAVELWADVTELITDDGGTVLSPGPFMLTGGPNA